MEDDMDTLQPLLDDLANEIDELTHDVGAWATAIFQLLKSLELHAMANDPDHPGQYEVMLKELRDILSSRLKSGSW